MPFVSELPKTVRLDYYEPESGNIAMEFRLIYKGHLPPEGQDGHDPDMKRARAPDKQRLRKHFHRQLRELWNQHPDLRLFAERKFIAERGGLATEVSFAVPGEPGKTWLEHIAGSHITCNGNKFVPLVRKVAGFTCSLDILFLRRDNPGNLIKTGGDLDNRIKVLLDGLKMPMQLNELGGIPIDADDEVPFYCLLEDDSLVTSVSVTTDRLIVPQEGEEKIHDVLLIVHVTLVNPSALFAGDLLP